MLYVGLIIGLIAGAVAMYLKSHKDIDAVTTALEATQDKLKSVKSQLYKRRSTYKKKSNSQANGKKAVKKTTRKQTTANSKNSNI
jgi:uncharacterized membrane-anchored protein YhcB (DUF1043 family)